jgi:aldehyde dehydrogenase (NAD+)
MNTDIDATLRHLGLGTLNPGAWSGSHGWSSTTDGALLNVRSPANGNLIAQVRPASVQDYEHVVSSAVEVAARWREVPAPKRGEVVRLIGEELRRHKDDLGTLVSLENGKILAEGLGEVQEMIDIADFAVGQSRMLYGLSMHSERPQHRMFEQWHPLGVIGIISAFNFPVAVWSWNAFLGAVCGNACVWKPSHKTPLTALAVQHLCNRVLEAAHLPAVFQLFVDGGTGLGGNNAVIVDETANLDLAVPAIVFGAVGTAGQRCTSTRRVFAHKAIAAELERRLVHAYRQVRIGDPLESGTLMGPLIDAQAVESYTAAVGAARSAGGELLYGGRVLERPGNFVEPAIIRVRNEWPIVQTETFAPILYLIPVDSLKDAIAEQNASAHGLSSALFTDRLQSAEAFLSSAGSDCGIANINLGTSGAEIGGAFGGEKDTGGGRESGSDAWKAYMRRQTNTVNWSRELPLAQGIEFKVE